MSESALSSRARVFLSTVSAFVLASCSERPAAAPPAPREYLYAWTASADTTQPDFLAVLDVTEADTARYGQLVTTLPVPWKSGSDRDRSRAASGRWW